MAGESNFFEDVLAGKEESDFAYFEPFDAPPRPQWVIDLAAKYEVNLNPEGDPFQTGLLMDTSETPGYSANVAANQTGKSRVVLVESIILASGQIPISMRYDKGVDTGIPRKVNDFNIVRFGLNKEGNCGNIIGVGKYPVEKIPLPNSGTQIWIYSYQQIREKMWKPRLDELIPPYFLNHNKGVRGFSEGKQMYFFDTSATISLNTYEQGFTRMEGEKNKVVLIVLDEEPPDRRFLTSAIEHCKYLRLCFTPLRGLSWFYYDEYLPIINGQNKNAKIFSCTQFDSPNQNIDKVKLKLKSYKPYEVKPKIFGRFSEMVGKPYYDFSITDKFLKAYVPRHTLARILPLIKPDTVRDAIIIKMTMQPAEEPGVDVWEIYEPYNERDAYWISADAAEGSDDPGLVQNKNAAYIHRLPRADEKFPVMAAALHTGMRNVEFAWMCLFAACRYNFALIAPESRGDDGAVFLATIADYPHLYRHVNTNEKTNRLQERFGFDTTAATRKLIFDLVGTWIYDHIENSRIFHYPLLKELNECITGKGGRPDHSERGSTDCIVAFGVGLYVYEIAKTQIRCNRYAHSNQDNDDNGIRFPNVRGLHRDPIETRRVLGSRRGLDARFGYSKMATRQ